MINAPNSEYRHNLESSQTEMLLLLAIKMAEYTAETDLNSEGNQLEDKFNGKDTGEDHVQVIQDLRVDFALAIELNKQTNRSPLIPI